MAKRSIASHLHKRVLVPFYVVRFIIYLLYLVSLTWILVHIADPDSEYGSFWRFFSHASVFVIIFSAVSVLLVVVLCAILDIVCIVKHARETLSHRFFLIVNVAETVLWTVLYVLTYIGPKTTIGVIVNSVVYVSFVGLLIYASIAFHKKLSVSRYSVMRYDAPPAVDGHYEPYSNHVGDMHFEQGMSDVPKPQATASAHLLEHRYG